MLNMMCYQVQLESSVEGKFVSVAGLVAYTRKVAVSHRSIWPRVHGDPRCMFPVGPVLVRQSGV